MIKIKSQRNNTNEFMLVVCLCLKYSMESQQQDNKQHLAGGRNKKKRDLDSFEVNGKTTINFSLLRISPVTLQQMVGGDCSVRRTLSHFHVIALRH